jgi:hypothetical protein
MKETLSWQFSIVALLISVVLVGCRRRRSLMISLNPLLAPTDRTTVEATALACRRQNKWYPFTA